MSDTREAILVRLEEIARDVENIKKADRDTIEFSDNDYPAISILEGDEEINQEFDAPNRPSDRPQIVYMIPHVVILVGERVRDVGPALSQIRGALIKAIMTDSQLRSMTTAIKYHGLSSDLAFGRDMLGQTALRFLLKYWLEPTKF